MYLYADYYMKGLSIAQQFDSLRMTMDRNGCSVDLATDLELADLVTIPIVDISAGNEVGVQTAPYGGAGALPSDHGINVWDITDLFLADSDCAATAVESLDFQSPGPVDPHVAWQFAGRGAVVRALRLYIGHEEIGSP